ncbi:MAG: hypothetical protein JWO42_642, partial [Chloroflexi bacterium]|nr:hypothetical protein [Chloroflexota bacterium]
MSSITSPLRTKGISRWPRTWWWGALSLLLVIVVAVAAGIAVAQRQTNSANGAPNAPGFSLPYAYGGQGQLGLDALRGHPVILNFTNSQCGPCLDELPTLRWAAQTYKGQGVRVVSVATSADTATAAGRLATALHLPFPMLIDNQAVSWQYDVQAVPATFFLDTHGQLQGLQVGPLDKQTVRNGLAQAGAISCTSCGPVASVGPMTADMSGHNLAADVVFNPAKHASYFALPDQNGKIITPASLHGKVVVLTFLSSVCREQCPLVGVTVRLMRRMLGVDASRLSVVVVSVDPEQDSAANTRAFAQEAGWQGTDWHYVTAPRSVLAPIWSAYGIYVPAPSPIFKPGQTIVHQAGMYLLD